MIPEQQQTEVRVTLWYGHCYCGRVSCGSVALHNTRWFIPNIYTEATFASSSVPVCLTSSGLRSPPVGSLTVVRWPTRAANVCPMTIAHSGYIGPNNIYWLIIYIRRNRHCWCDLTQGALFSVDKHYNLQQIKHQHYTVLKKKKKNCHLSIMHTTNWK